MLYAGNVSTENASAGVHLAGEDSVGVCSTAVDSAGMGSAIEDEPGVDNVYVNNTEQIACMQIVHMQKTQKQVKQRVKGGTACNASDADASYGKKNTVTRGAWLEWNAAINE